MTNEMKTDNVQQGRKATRGQRPWHLGLVGSAGGRPGLVCRSRERLNRLFYAGRCCRGIGRCSARRLGSLFLVLASLGLGAFILVLLVVQSLLLRQPAAGTQGFILDDLMNLGRAPVEKSAKIKNRANVSITVCNRWSPSRQCKLLDSRMLTGRTTVLAADAACL